MVSGTPDSRHSRTWTIQRQELGQVFRSFRRLQLFVDRKWRLSMERLRHTPIRRDEQSFISFRFDNLFLGNRLTLILQPASEPVVHLHPEVEAEPVRERRSKPANPICVS